MTTTPDIQVPGQLELPLEFEKPIIKTVTYIETYTETVRHTVELEVPANYKPLMERILEDPVRYQRTLRSLITGPEQYDGVKINSIGIQNVEAVEDLTDFRIR